MDEKTKRARFLSKMRVRKHRYLKLELKKIAAANAAAVESSSAHIKIGVPSTSQATPAVFPGTLLLDEKKSTNPMSICEEITTGGSSSTNLFDAQKQAANRNPASTSSTINSPSTSKSSSTDNGNSKRDEVDEVRQLRQWAIECNVPHSELDKLLKILRKRLPDLPSSSQEFLRMDSKIQGMKNVSGKVEGERKDNGPRVAGSIRPTSGDSVSAGSDSPDDRWRAFISGQLGRM